MEKVIHLEILPQPDDSTCGATCLQAVYNYHGEHIALPPLIEDVHHLEEGGTLGVFLAQHALNRGYRATIHTYNLAIFDPTWFLPGAAPLEERLAAQMKVKRGQKFQVASHAYAEFVRNGGEIRHEPLTSELIRGYLSRSVPIIAGLSCTYLYGTARERTHGTLTESDDIGGTPVGHFVVLCGYNRSRRTVRVADPYRANPIAGEPHYEVDMYRLIGAILLGVLTYDANLLVIEPRSSHA